MIDGRRVDDFDAVQPRLLAQGMSLGTLGGIVFGMVELAVETFSGKLPTT